ncbi:MAG: tetratricopeptide repeat-containing glycosyltransferase family protein [Pirellulaceae bacterium]
MNALEQQLARGWQVHQQRQFAEAERIYRDVLSRFPNNAAAWCYLGIALHDQRRYATAIEAYTQALKWQADFPVALNNLGNSLRYVGEFEQADASFQRAIDLKPDYINAYKNRGTLHVWIGHLEQGLGYYEQALALNPNDAELHRNLGVIYLLQGKFEAGWREYRWRWRVGDLKRSHPAIPVWDGSDPAGKSILLTVEQGLGDTLHFVRYAQVLLQAGAKTTVYCQPPLMALLQASRGLGHIYPSGLPIEQQFDYQCSLLDVADLLHTDLTSIPANGAYIQPADHLVQYWKQRLPARPGKLRIGIAWQGNPDHQADIFRSVPLGYFECLARLPNVELICLQNGFGVEQLDVWRGPQITVLDANLDRSSGAFMDTAAIMHSLDLVITSDTSIAHLAGAMEIPTWLALGYMPDWRWLLDRDDSPWYPSARLFRQPTIGDWDSVFQAMRNELANMTSK